MYLQVRLRKIFHKILPQPKKDLLILNITKEPNYLNQVIVKLAADFHRKLIIIQYFYPKVEWLKILKKHIMV